MLFASFVLLLFAIISIWIRKTFWIWGGALILSLTLAYLSSHLLPIAFIPLALMLAATLTIQANPSGLSRWIFLMVLFLLSGSFFYSLFPGLPSPLHLLGGELIYGKILAGTLLLGILVPTLTTLQDLKTFIKQDLPLSLLGAFFLISMSWYIRGSSPMQTTPLLGIPWLLIQLWGSILPEEALLRGVIQKEFFSFIGKGAKGHVLAILLASLLTPLFYLAWVADYRLLGLTATMGFFCGLIYQITGRVEGSASCRFFATIFYLVSNF